MRLFTMLCAALVLSGLAVAQTPIHLYSGYGYGYGPYVPLVTTPEISFETVSTNSPVGATNATGGLVAGARNSTLSIVNGNISAVYTQPVWYSGGTSPVISSPSVQLPSQNAMPMHMEMMGSMMHMDHGHERTEGPRVWTYFGEASISSAAEASASAKVGKHATRTYTNQDIDQENQKTGMVKYDGKTEQIK
jgi:hypothetical protein